MEAIDTRDLAYDAPIQVSSLHNFQKTEWRKAILRFVFGIWADDDSVIYRPKIELMGACLWYDEVAKTYDLVGTVNQDESLWPITGKEANFEQTVMVLQRNGASEVEVSLMRFVKNDVLRRLTLRFADGGVLVLTKGRKRGDLQVTGYVA